MRIWCSFCLGYKRNGCLAEAATGQTPWWCYHCSRWYFVFGLVFSHLAAITERAWVVQHNNGMDPLLLLSLFFTPSCCSLVLQRRHINQRPCMHEATHQVHSVSSSWSNNPRMSLAPLTTYLQTSTLLVVVCQNSVMMYLLSPPCNLLPEKTSVVPLPELKTGPGWTSPPMASGVVALNGHILIQQQFLASKLIGNTNFTPLVMVVSWLW